MRWVPFWPESASITARSVDQVFIAELVLVVLILAAVFGMLFVFAVRYRSEAQVDRSHRTAKTWHWEIGWTTATLAVFLGLFVWGAHAYVYLYVPPASDLEIYVVAKQWMWKIQHPGGQREIDELHVPIGKTVRLVLTSEDVIHSFYIPAFRVKHDVLPGQYATFWFQADRLGEFPLQCAE